MPGSPYPVYWGKLSGRGWWFALIIFARKALPGVVCVVFFAWCSLPLKVQISVLGVVSGICIIKQSNLLGWVFLIKFAGLDLQGRVVWSGWLVGIC